MASKRDSMTNYFKLQFERSIKASSNTLFKGVNVLLDIVCLLTSVCNKPFNQLNKFTFLAGLFGNRTF